ncbi:MAG TPA: single-stranded-DNA-specific exonuclease RecJ [Anaerolineales bacterium]|nr:single-stranded-DNA-specific exonuclease RecJ [Anaerolineales bacterium]
MTAVREWIFPQESAEPLGGFSRAAWHVLRSRGVRAPEEADRLLDAASGREHDPFLLDDMAVAVNRIRTAVDRREKIVVYGDYDADGLTATALLVSALEELGVEVDAFIPSRFEEGYGLNEGALVRLKDSGAALVVSVDCGGRAVREAQAAAEAGLDLIVTDHHEPGPELPAAVAVVNPKRRGDSYPFKGLSGVGLAFKLVSAIEQATGAKFRALERKDLVAVGTVADLVPLVDENRTLVAQGIAHLRDDSSVGLAGLAEVAGIQRRRLTARDIAFGLGPRLNAAGRLGSAWAAYRLLKSVDTTEAMSLAGELDAANRERQDATKSLLEDVRNRLERHDKIGPVIFEADESYGEGLLGPAAAKLVEEWHRPAIVVALRGGEARGSARSVRGFHITQALEACAPLLWRFGGHEAAAGFSLDANRVEELGERLAEIARRQDFAPTAPPVEVDVTVAPDEISTELMEFLDRLEPFGMGFPPPLFACLGMTLMGTKAVGRDRSHLRLLLRHPHGAREAIAFRQGHRRLRPGSVVDVAFYAERDVYMGVESVRWNVQALRNSPGS